jgi:hypothetical protein
MSQESFADHLVDVGFAIAQNTGLATGDEISLAYMAYSLATFQTVVMVSDVMHGPSSRESKVALAKVNKYGRRLASLCSMFSGDKLPAWYRGLNHKQIQKALAAWQEIETDVFDDARYEWARYMIDTEEEE